MGRIKRTAKVLCLEKLKPSPSKPQRRSVKKKKSAMVKESPFGIVRTPPLLLPDSPDVGNVQGENAERRTKRSGSRRSEKLSRKRNRAASKEQLRKRSKWLWSASPRRTPYVPQLEDIVSYFHQGHERYVQQVIKQRLFQFDAEVELPWNYPIQTEEACLITELEYVNQGTVELCRLMLAQLDSHGARTGLKFTVIYHDMKEVPDFLVLKQHVDSCRAIAWKANDPFQLIVEDVYEFWRIAAVSPLSEHHPDSPFQAIEVVWSNDLRERLSSWDIEPFNVLENGKKCSGCPATVEDLRRLSAYESTATEWGEGGKADATACLVAVVDAICSKLNPADEAFQFKMQLIRSRLLCGFYRRLKAAIQDMNAAFTLTDNEVELLETLRSVAIAFLRNENASITADADQCLREMAAAANLPFEDGSFAHLAVAVGAPPSAGGAGGHHRPATGPEPAAIGRNALRTSTLNKTYRQCVARVKSGTFYGWKWDCFAALKALAEMPESLNFRTLKQTPFELILATERPMFLSIISGRLSKYESLDEFDRDLITLFANAKALYGFGNAPEDYRRMLTLWRKCRSLFKPIYQHYLTQAGQQLAVNK